MIDVIIFNGPPQCGKDTAKKFILERFPESTRELRFAAPLKRSVHELLCLDEIEEEAYAHLKDVASVEAFGHTMREVYIHQSEAMLKSMFGKDIFGKLWMRNYRKLLTEWHDISDWPVKRERNPANNRTHGRQLV